MADYRFSAQVIKRSDGRSAVAAAAYRAAEQLHDHRHGQACDYSRKAGVLHAEILTPDGTPDWMRDRSQLWNAVEAVERRKDAQLAREVQLSLPHELSQEQRLDLVRGFVRDQFVSRGMVADLAVHAPDRDGDQRNHHAHVMLTMRSLTGDGFGNKAREWNDTQQLEQWREKWAQHQNRALERYGHPARVDHRSFEARGIDREPTQHLGRNASDMERRGKGSRIGDQNRQTDRDNIERVENHLAAARVASDRARFSQWAQEKKAELEAAQDLTKLDLAQKHDRQKTALENQLLQDYGQTRATVAAELAATERRLEAKGVRKLLRTVFGQTRTDREAHAHLTASLKDIDNRERERREQLALRQAGEMTRLEERQEQRREAQARGIDRAAGRAESDSRERHVPKPKERTEAPSPAKAMRQATNDNTPQQESPREAESDRLGLDDRKQTADVHLERYDSQKGDRKIEKPWRQASRREAGAKPWRSEGRQGGQERTPPNSRKPN